MTAAGYDPSGLCDGVCLCLGLRGGELRDCGPCVAVVGFTLLPQSPLPPMGYNRYTGFDYIRAAGERPCENPHSGWLFPVGFLCAVFFFASPNHDARWISFISFLPSARNFIFFVFMNKHIALAFSVFFSSEFPPIFLFAELLIPCHRYQNLSSFSLISQYLSTPKHHPIFTMAVLTSPIVQFLCITRLFRISTLLEH